MRVLFVINSMNIGGAEKLLVESIPFFQNQGVNVDVLILAKDTSLPLWKDLENKCSGKVFGLTTKSIYNPLLIFKLAKVFRDYSLVHIHLFPALYWSVLAKIFTGKKIRLYYTEHSTHNKRRERWYFKIIDRFIYSFLEKIIAISDDVKENLINHLGNSFEKKICLIQNGIDILKFRNAQPYAKGTFFTSDSIIISQVSNFRYPKDQKTIIKALQLLDSRIKLLLIGIGENLEECKDLCRDLVVADRVQFLGLRTDIPQLLKSSDILVLSSAYEGLSLSNIEGMSCGKPFVATNVPGIKDVVENYGLLFDYQDYKKFADIINLLVSDNLYYEKIANKCKDRSNSFDINYMVSDYILTYENN